MTKSNDNVWEIQWNAPFPKCSISEMLSEQSLSVQLFAFLARSSSVLSGLSPLTWRGRIMIANKPAL